MTSHNDITGDKIISAEANDAYRTGYDRIFGKKKPELEQTPKSPVDEVPVKITDDPTLF